MNTYLSNIILSMGDITNWEDKLRFMDIKVINVSDFTELFLRMVLNTLMIFIVIHFIYAKNSKRKDFYFSFLSLGFVIFMITFLLNSVKLEMGFALGLFAIFGIIRYRTDAIPIKEMTYLFIIIGISVINALANKKVSYVELAFANFAIVGGLWFLEKRLMLKQERSINLTYEKIENIHTMSELAFLEDLKTRTGINISRYEIKKIDFLKDSAEVKLYYPVSESQHIN